MMAMVPGAAILHDGEIVCIAVARSNGTLAQAIDAVHVSRIQ